MQFKNHFYDNIEYCTVAICKLRLLSETQFLLFVSVFAPTNNFQGRRQFTAAKLFSARRLHILAYNQVSLLPLCFYFYVFTMATSYAKAVCLSLCK